MLLRRLTQVWRLSYQAISDAIANIATVISGTTNNSGHAISAGEYFIANGAKYKASATIDTSATWSDKSTSVSDHDLINALNSNIQYIESHRINQDLTAGEEIIVNLTAPDNIRTVPGYIGDGVIYQWYDKTVNVSQLNNQWRFIFRSRESVTRTFNGYINIAWFRP